MQDYFKCILLYYTMNMSVFNNAARFDSDPVDRTRRFQDNMRYSEHMLTGFNTMNSERGYVNFATEHPGLMFGGTAYGRGLGGGQIDADSALIIKSQQERSLEKLSLNQRPFVTVPYLGRGMGDPTIESQLQQGEFGHEPRSVASATEKSFLAHEIGPSDEHMKEFVQDPRYTVEEAALDGWVRGGSTTRA